MPEPSADPTLRAKVVTETTRSPLRRSLIACAVLMILTGCGSVAPATRSSTHAAGSAALATATQLAKVKLLTSWLPSANQLPFFLGVARGYFRKQGLDVTIVDGKGSAPTVEAVGSGRYPFGWASLDIMALSAAKGVPVEGVMGGIQKQPFGVFVPKNSPIRSMKDLPGHSVIVTPGSPETFYLPAVAKIQGFDIRKVDLIDVSAADKVSDYIDGKGDAMATDGPYADAVVQPKRPSRILYFADYGLVSPSFGLFVRSSYLKHHPGTVRHFVAASVESWNAMLHSASAAKEAIRDMIKVRPQAKINPQEMLTSWNMYRPFVATARTRGHPFGWQSSADWRQALSMLHKYAGLKGSLDAAHYFTNAYLPAR